MGRRHQIFSAISAVFRPILWALGMETPDYEEFRLEGMVEGFYSYIQHLCTLNSNARDRFKDPKSFPVYRIKMYKNQSLSQHEYIVAEVSPKGCPKVYIKLERLGPSGPDNTSQNSRNHSGSFTPSLTSIDSVSNSSKAPSLKCRSANDRIRILTGWPIVKTTLIGNGNSDILLAEVSSFKCTTLYDLVIIAYTVHNYSPIYELLNPQCYWFANLIIRVLECCDARAKRTVHVTEDAEVLRQGLSGRWDGFMIHRAQEEMVEELTQLFVEEKEKFKNSVFERERKAAEADLRVEAATRKAAEADLRADAVAAEAKRANAAADLKIQAEAKRADAAAAEAKRANAVAAEADLKIRAAEERIQQLMAQLELTGVRAL